MTTAMKDGKGYELVRAEERQPVPVLHLYDILGEDLLGGISARRVVEDLRALGDAPELEVRLSSSGGDVFEGIAVYNALTRFPGKVTVHVDAIAASIASLVALAGDRTLVAENAMLMVHRPWTAMMGDAEELRRQAETLDKAWSVMLATYARRTGKRPATLAQRVQDAGGEWWMTAEEAVAEGFADGVEKTDRTAAVFGLKRFKRVPERLAARATDADHRETANLPGALEVAPPRVEKPPLPEEVPVAAGPSRDARRRMVEVLRLLT